MNKNQNSTYLKNKIRQYFSSYHRSHPEIIQIEVTNLCNLNCRTCGRKSFLSKFGSMSIKDYEKILSKFQIEQIQKIHFGGYGEPLLNKNLIDMIKRIPPEIYTSTNTNLSINDDDSIIAFADSGLSEINVSLDGFGKTAYEDVRIGGDWDLIIKNIKLINQHKKFDTKFNIHSVVYSMNLSSYLQNISNLLQIINIDKIIFVGMKSHGDNDAIRSKQKFFSPQEIDYIKSVTEKNNVELVIKKNKKIKRCFRPDNEMYILFDGSVTPCCNIVDDSFYNFGNLLKSDNLNEVWNSAAAISFREKLAHGTPHHLCTEICDLTRS